MSLLIPIINAIYYIILILIFARIIFSWMRPDPYHHIWGPIMRFVYQFTEPMLEPIRKLMPSSGGMDFSPMILLFGLYIARMLIFSII